MTESTMIDNWQPIAVDGNFDYDDTSLEANWDLLHLCDHEPFPSPSFLKSLCEQYPLAKKSIPHFNDDYDALSQSLLEAWRLFHRGDFGGARSAGLALGYPGYHVANMATCVYASTVKMSEKVIKTYFWESAQRSLEASQAMPGHINSTYHYGLNLGRYSETISLIRAAAENIAGKFTKALHHTLQHNPDHVLANIGLGTYHSSVISIAGPIVGKLTYGVSKQEALKHFEHGLKIAPQLPVVYIEYAKGMVSLEGKKGKAKAIDLYSAGAQITPIDATQEIDIKACTLACR